MVEKEEFVNQYVHYCYLHDHCMIVDSICERLRLIMEKECSKLWENENLPKVKSLKVNTVKTLNC